MAKPRRPTDEEKALWRRVTTQVTPLRPATPAADPGPAKATAKSAGATRRSGTSPRVQPTAPSRPAPPSPPELVSGQTPSVDRRTADRLKRGRMAVEARLDLHGMGQADAHRALNGFIEGSYAKGLRTVLVITGKGLFSQGRGVLRDRLGDWLNMGPLRHKVLSYVPAQPKHGGGGAFYVLLRRRRDKG